MHDFGEFFLAAAVGPGDQHRKIGARDLAGEGEGGFGQRIGVHEAAQFVLVQRGAAPTVARVPACELLPGLRQLQQVVDRDHQFAIVPRLGQIIGGAGLDQFHCGFQMRPRGEQDHRQIRMMRADFAEQRDAFFARSGVVLEIHVLHHQIHRRLAQCDQTGFGAGRDARVDIVQREQRLQRGGDSGVVVDDEDRGHGRSVTQWDWIAGGAMRTLDNWTVIPNPASSGEGPVFLRWKTGPSLRSG